MFRRMLPIPGWIAGAAISLGVILIGNLVQSLIEGHRERRQKRREWYEETASLARQITKVYERRLEVAKQRRDESDNLPKEMTRGVKREIREEMFNKVDELSAHERTDFEINDGVSDLIDQVDQEVIRLKREGLEDRIDDVLDVCNELEAEANEVAKRYEFRLL